MGKTPSFKGFRPVSEASSRTKQANKRTDTAPELLLRSELRRLGLHFEENAESLPGRPDIVFPQVKVAVFCDGDFWHGRDWSSLKAKLDEGSNASYWTAKIAANIERDQRNTALLEKQEWLVIRLWETDIKRDLRGSVDRVLDAVRARHHAGSGHASRDQEH